MSAPDATAPGPGESGQVSSRSQAHGERHSVVEVERVAAGNGLDPGECAQRTGRSRYIEWSMVITFVVAALAGIALYAGWSRKIMPAVGNRQG